MFYFIVKQWSYGWRSEVKPRLYGQSQPQHVARTVGRGEHRGSNQGPLRAPTHSWGLNTCESRGGGVNLWPYYLIRLQCVFRTWPCLPARGTPCGGRP